MDDVKLELTPSAELLKAAKAEATITDSKGRAIVLKKPGVLAQYRLVEALGKTASNEVYMGMVLPLIYIASIDGEPVSATNKLQIEALIQRLDEDGIQAVMKGVQDNFGAPDPGADKAALKN
jgi:hypothetical protein